jgi:hypothetical protein
MFGYVQIAEWPSSRVMAATKWCVVAAVSSFASAAARQLLVMIISGRPFTLFLFLQARGGILDICLFYLAP